jgi:hypothetical protein
MKIDGQAIRTPYRYDISTANGERDRAPVKGLTAHSLSEPKFVEI